MAPSRKLVEPAETGKMHPVHLRLPNVVFARLDAKARAENRPMNPIVVAELAAYPQLAGQVQFGKLLAAMENMLQHYGARIVLADLGEQLFKAVDHLLATAKAGGQLQPRIDALSVLRTAMLRHERAAVMHGDPLQEITPEAPEITEITASERSRQKIKAKVE